MAAEEADSPSRNTDDPFATATPETARFTGGLAEAILTSQPVERVLARIEENRLAVRQLIQNLYELEQHVERLATLQDTDHQRIRNVEDQVEIQGEQIAALEARISAVEQRSEAVSDIFSDKLIKRQTAHADAKRRDATEAVTRGERYDLVVEELLLGEFPPKVQGRIDGLVVFVDVRDRTTDIVEGDVLEVQITDIQKSCAHARVCDDGGDGA